MKVVGRFPFEIKRYNIILWAIWLYEEYKDCWLEMQMFPLPSCIMDHDIEGSKCFKHRLVGLFVLGKLAHVQRKN